MVVIAQKSGEYLNLNNLIRLHGSSTCTELSGHWRLFLVSFYFLLLLATWARLSWPLSAFEPTLNSSSIVPYRIVVDVM